MGGSPSKSFADAKASVEATPGDIKVHVEFCGK